MEKYFMSVIYKGDGIEQKEEEEFLTLTAACGYGSRTVDEFYYSALYTKGYPYTEISVIGTTLDGKVFFQHKHMTKDF